MPLRILILISVLMVGQSSYAQESPINYIANIGGACKVAEVGGRDQLAQCKGNLVNVGYKTGRVMFLFTAGGPFAFSGDHDRQPSPDNYELDVTNVNVNQRRIQAKGRCSMKGDPAISATYTCEAIVDAEQQLKLRFVFESSGKPQVVR
jgi:hypothetical protein